MRTQNMVIQAPSLLCLIVAFSLAPTAKGAPNPPSVPCAVDWPTRSASCPGQITQSGTQTFKVTGINDVAMDFLNGAVPHYVLIAKGTPASQVAPADFLGLFLAGNQAAAKAAGGAKAAAQCTYAGQTYADKISLACIIREGTARSC